MISKLDHPDTGNVLKSDRFPRKDKANILLICQSYDPTFKTKELFASTANIRSLVRRQRPHIHWKGRDTGCKSVVGLPSGILRYVEL